MNEPAEDHDDGDRAPGWDAIDALLHRVYGAQEPLHMGTLVRYADGGPDPLDGVSAYLHPEGHWHYVGFGLTELDDKQSERTDLSGWGFELTVRLQHHGTCPPRPWSSQAPPPREAQAPAWPFFFLQHLARQVFAHDAIIEVDDLLPGAPPEAAGLAGFLAIEDPELGCLETPNGRLRFLQLVGVDAVQLARARGSAAGAAAVLAELRAASPLLVTRLRPG